MRLLRKYRPINERQIFSSWKSPPIPNKFHEWIEKVDYCALFTQQKIVKIYLWFLSSIKKDWQRFFSVYNRFSFFFSERSEGKESIGFVSSRWNFKNGQKWLETLWNVEKTCFWATFMCVSAACALPQ